MRVAALGLLVACGYRFAAGRSLPGEVRTVEVPMFRNATAEPGAEASFALALRDVLALEGLLAKESADAQAQGEVLSVSNAPSVVVPIDGGYSLATYRVEAAARLRLIKDGHVVGETEVSGAEDYLPGVDLLQTEAARRAATQRLAVSLMREALRKLRAQF